MKNIFVYILLLCILSQGKSSAQIIISLNRDGNDGSKTMTKEDSLSVHQFSIENYGKSLTYNSRKDIYFELINGQQLKEVCSKSKYTWVFIQSSTCGACYIVLKEYMKIADSLKTEGLSLVVINQDFYVKKLKKKIIMEDYSTLSYIIDPSNYGSDQTGKQNAFIKEMVGDQKLKGYSPNAVPQDFFFDNVGNLVYYRKENTITKSFIQEEIINK